MESTDLVDTATAAELLGVTADSLNRWRRNRVGPPWMQIGVRMVKYRRSAIEEYLRAQTETPDPRPVRQYTKAATSLGES